MSSSGVIVRQATADADLKAVKECFNAYTQWLGIDLTFQDYATELASLPGKYMPPAGALLLAVDESSDQVLGCVAMRPIELHSDFRTTERRCARRYCEMKRLFVYPEARGRNVARTLISEVVQRAQRQGYDEILLDTLDKMKPAIKLYQSEGFVPIEPYYPNHLDGVFYFAKAIQNLA